MVANTYFLAPGFEFPPGSSIFLGSLLSNPLSPHISLAGLSQWPDVTQTIQKEAVIVKGRGNGAELSFGGQLLEAIGAKAAGSTEKSQTTEYTMAALRTEFFKQDPDENNIKTLIAECPRARKILLDTPIWKRGKLFMITGLKIAEGFSMSSSKTVRHEANVSATAPILTAAGLGLEAGAGGFGERSEGMSMKSEGDVILAYRLVKITLKGFKKQELTLEEYSSSNSGRLLGYYDEEGQAVECDQESVRVGELDMDSVTDQNLESDDDDDETEFKTVAMGVDPEEGPVQVLDVFE